MRLKMKYLVILTQLLLLLLLLLKIKYLTLVIQSKKTHYNRKINEVEKKITDNHGKYITTPEFNKLMAENLVVGLAKTILASKIDIANLVKKTDFDDKL